MLNLFDAQRQWHVTAIYFEPLKNFRYTFKGQSHCFRELRSFPLLIFKFLSSNFDTFYAVNFRSSSPQSQLQPFLTSACKGDRETTHLIYSGSIVAMLKLKSFVWKCKRKISQIKPRNTSKKQRERHVTTVFMKLKNCLNIQLLRNSNISRKKFYLWLRLISTRGFF